MIICPFDQTPSNGSASIWGFCEGHGFKGGVIYLSFYINPSQLRLYQMLNV